MPHARRNRSGERQTIDSNVGGTTVVDYLVMVMHICMHTCKNKVLSMDVVDFWLCDAIDLQ